MEDEVEDFIEHVGVKGMKWGKRRNSGYTDQQVKRDIQVYGNRGAKRINKALNSGDQISTARGNEKTRRDTVTSKNKYYRQGGKLLGGAAGGVVGFVGARLISKAANSSAGRSMASKLLGSYAGMATTALRSPAVTAVVTAGAARVGYMLSGDIAVGLNMRANGYNPNRKY